MVAPTMVAILQKALLQSCPHLQTTQALLHVVGQIAQQLGIIVGFAAQRIKLLQTYWQLSGQAFCQPWWCRWLGKNTAGTCLFQCQAHLLHMARPRLYLGAQRQHSTVDRKSTRLNSSHVRISYAVFCLKKKK